jgi:hypothetical protein
MKKNLSRRILILSIQLLVLSVISSCNQNNPAPNNPAPSSNLNLAWTATINGQNYSWQGSYPNNMSSGQASTAFNQSDGSLNIVLVNQTGPKTLSIKIPTPGVGTYVISGGTFSNPGTKNIQFMNGGTVSHTTLAGGSVTLNITEYSQSVYGSVKGNFSGTIGAFPSGGNKTISGSFEAFRAN